MALTHSGDRGVVRTGGERLFAHAARGEGGGHCESGGAAVWAGEREGRPTTGAFYLPSLFIENIC